MRELQDKFEAWFEPDEYNRKSLRHWRHEDGNYYTAPYLNGCWNGWKAGRESLAASHQRLKEALTRLLTQFPTDTDMLAAGWENSEVNAACDAYDHAREALRSTP